MRTKVTLDDNVAAIASQYAHSRGLSLSKAIAELILHSTRKAPRIKHVDGLPVFDLPGRSAASPASGQRARD